MSDFFYGRTDTDLLTWSKLFSAAISADPNAFHVLPEDAAELAVRQAAYAEAFARACDPSTRTKISVAERREMAKQLIACAKPLVMRIGSDSRTTDEQRMKLSLNIRKKWTRRDVPTEPPSIRVLDREGTWVTIQLRQDGTSSARARPKNASGAMVYAAIDDGEIGGPAKDPKLLDWKTCGAYGQTKIRLAFAGDLRPGTRVWLCASWYNASGEGKRCDPISTYIAGGMMTSWAKNRVAA